VLIVFDLCFRGLRPRRFYHEMSESEPKKSDGAASPVLPVNLPPARYGVRWENWARIQSCTPAAYFAPSSYDQLRAVLRLAQDNKQTVKVALISLLTGC
jgi:hypothetical protein